MVERSPASDEDPEQTPRIRRAGLQSSRRLRLPPDESGYQDQEIQQTQHRRRRKLNPLRRRNRATIRAADQAVIPFLTLSFFCGVRIATLERLSWVDVKFEERRVIVPRNKGKNQKRYPVTLSENALEWLRPYVRKSGSLRSLQRR